VKGQDLTDKQLRAAEQYILLRRASGNHIVPEPEQVVSQRWQDLVMLVAEYGAIRADSISKGGSVHEPGEIVLRGKKEPAQPAAEGSDKK
jgi:hypothetical protein